MPRISKGWVMQCNSIARFLWSFVVLPVAFLSIHGDSFASEWQLRLDGIGPLKIGMEFNAANKALGKILKKTPPQLRASVACDYVSVAGHPGLALMFVDDVLKRVDSTAPGVRTVTGVTIGDPVSKVHELYPGIQVEPNAYEPSEQYLTSPSDGLAIRFETRDGAISQFYAGAVTQVHFTEKCL